MAGEDLLSTNVMNLLEVEPSSGLEGGVVPALSAPGPDIPALREQLAVLVSTGKAKEAIGVQLTAGEAPERQRCREIQQTLRGIRGLKDNRKFDRQQYCSCNQSGRNVR